MGVDYLSTPADGNPVWPAKGKLYGENKRVMFTLPVSHENKVVSAHFVFDTGAPVTYVARSTVTALDIDGCPLSDAPIRVNGVIQYLLISDEQRTWDEGAQKWNDCHFKGLNLLGMDYLWKIDALLSIDMAKGTATLCKQS